MSSTAPIVAHVLDYSYAHQDPTEMRLKGIAGAMRYLGNDGRCLFTAERDELFAEGRGIGLVYEKNAERPLTGRGGGQVDAREADAFASLGFPTSVPIFGTCIDFGATVHQIKGPCAEHARAALATSEHPWGVYGPYDAIEILHGIFGDELLYWQSAGGSGYGTGSGGSLPSIADRKPRRVSQFSCMFQQFGSWEGHAADLNVCFRPPTWLYHPSNPIVVPTPVPNVTTPTEREILMLTAYGTSNDDKRFYIDSDDHGSPVRLHVPDETTLKALKRIHFLAADEVILDVNNPEDLAFAGALGKIREVEFSLIV